ncbi:MAG: PD-(D/E)XK nuclease family protein, partial [Steroidobacteraceae bacterium]
TIRRAERDESYTIAGLQLRLQPDRIDQLASGCLIVDYKLGAANEPRDWLDVWPGRPRKPQLPLYALAHADELAGLAFAVLAPGAVEYRGWSNGVEIAPGIAPYPLGTRRVFDPPIDWNALLQRWQQSLSTLALEYVRGEAPVDPLPDACTYCHLSTFCRIHERDEVDPEEMGIEDE